MNWSETERGWRNGLTRRMIPAWKSSAIRVAPLKNPTTITTTPND